MKNNLNKTSILLVFVVLLNAFFAGSCFFLWGKINTTAEQISTRDKEAAIQEMEKSSSSQLTNIVEEEINPAREEIDKYFVGEKNFVGFIELIEGLADKSDIIMEKRSSELEGSLQMGVDFQGSFSNSMYFVALVESLPINLKIENLEIEKKQEGDLWQGWFTVLLPGSGKE